MTGQQLEHLLSDPVQIGAQLLQHLRRNALTLPDQTQEDVFGTDIVVAQLKGLAQRKLEHFFRPWRKRYVRSRRRLAMTDDLLDLLTHAVERDSKALQRFRGHALTLMDKAEQDVLRADIAVIEHPGLFLRQDNHTTGTIGESFKHDTHVLAARPHAPHPIQARVRAMKVVCAESEPLGVDAWPTWETSLRSCRRAAVSEYNEGRSRTYHGRQGRAR